MKQTCLICGCVFIRSRNAPPQLLPDVCCSCNEIRSIDMETMSMGVLMDHIEKCKLLDKIERRTHFITEKEMEI